MSRHRADSLYCCWPTSRLTRSVSTLTSPDPLRICCDSQSVFWRIIAKNFAWPTSSSWHSSFVTFTHRRLSPFDNLSFVSSVTPRKSSLPALSSKPRTTTWNLHSDRRTTLSGTHKLTTDFSNSTRKQNQKEQERSRKLEQRERGGFTLFSTQTSMDS